MAKLIGLEVSSVSGYNDMQTVNMVATVFENFNSIVELDFAKSVISRIYEGLSVNIFKWNSQLYLQRVNEAMREAIVSIAGDKQIENEMDVDTEIEVHLKNVELKYQSVD